MKLFEYDEFINESVKKLVESRFADVLDKYKGKIDQHEIYKFSLEDPSKQNLYLQWMIEQKLKGNKDIDILSIVKAYFADHRKPEEIYKYDDAKQAAKAVGYKIHLN